MTDQVDSEEKKGKLSGQMNEIDKRLKGIERRIGNIEFSLSPGNSPSVAGVIFGNADRLKRIEERLQRIEIAAGIFADIDKLEKIAERLRKIEEKLGSSN
jgi:tetrahydromethanopterin S-methyltransferase subunit G